MSKISIKENDKTLFAKKRVLREDMITTKFNNKGENLSKRQQCQYKG